MKLISIFIIFCAWTIFASQKNRKEEFSRINKYELIHIHPETVDEHTKLIEFDAFDEHYKVELITNQDMIANKIHHSNIDPTSHKHQYFSSMTESCHYHGTVLNAIANTKSVVAVSLCPKRGIRGRITAFDETLIIYPSAYYLDLDKDKKCDYKLLDELIVYRISDFNADHILHDDDDILQTQHKLEKQHDDIPHKRRLYSESNPAHTEMLMISGPVRTRNYKEDYVDQWYQQMLADLTEMINAVSAIYKDTDFGSTVGNKNSITVVFKELEVIEAFDGIYKSLKPNKLYTNCELDDDSYDDSDLCAINGRSWLGTIQNWVYNNKDVSTFDHAQFMSDMRFKWSKSGMSTSRTLGWGGVGVLCRGHQSASDVSIVSDMGGNTAAIRTMAHELGHNFGMEHDGQSGAGASCPADAGLMGYSDGDGFSTCSITSMQEYFDQADGLTCLGKGWQGFRTENRFDDADTGIAITTNPTPKPTTRPTSTPTKTGETLSPTARPSTAPTRAPIIPTGCIRIDGISSSNNGRWLELEDTLSGGKAAYVNTDNAETYFLYYRDDLSFDGSSAAPSWYIGSVLGGTRISIYCAQPELLSCSSHFLRYTQNGWQEITSSTINADCTKSPTIKPTASPTTADATTAIPTTDTAPPSPQPTATPVIEPTASPSIDTLPPTRRPTAAPVATACVHIDGIDDIFYNGVWMEEEEAYDDKPVYLFQNAYGDNVYLYSRNVQLSDGAAGPHWLISSVKGSFSINVYCAEEELLDCSGKFNRYQNGWKAVNSSTIDTDCSVSSTCNKYQCLLTTGIARYSGRWNPVGCINGEAYYQLISSDDKYMCFSKYPNVNRWIITDVLCSASSEDMKALTLQETTDVLVGGGWFLSDGSGSFTQSFSASVSECSDNAAYHFDDLSCLSNNDVEKVCVYSNNSVLWNGYQTFESSTLCRNEQRVYIYVVYNESTEIGDNGIHNVENVYYLFFHQQLKYSDSNETIGQWLISKNEQSISSLALCEKDSLLDCMKSSWKVETTQTDDSVFDNLLIRAIDPYLTVSNGACDADMDKNGSKWHHALNSKVMRASIILVFAVCVIIIACVLCQKRRDNKKLTRLIGKSIGNESDLDEDGVYLAMNEEH